MPVSAPLAGRLQAFADEVRALSTEFADTVERMVARLKASGAGELAPAPGEAMPEFMLPDQDGRLVSLSDLVARGPVGLAESARIEFVGLFKKVLCRCVTFLLKLFVGPVHEVLGLAFRAG